MMNSPSRKYTRLAAQNYVGFRFYFVTLCCFGRKRIFVDAGHCERVLELLRTECAVRGFAVHAYCVMPDHFHFLCEGVEPGSDLLRSMMSFRIKSSRNFAKEHGGVLWQRGYYEHILRRGERAELVAWYIWLNPVRQGLVSKAEEYRWAGSFTGWKMPTSRNEEGWRPPWKGGGRSDAEE
jgi:REP-associated tyrosine transposase